MKNMLLFFTIIYALGVFNSCESQKKEKGSPSCIDQFCLGYIDYIKSSEYKNKELLIVLIEEESLDKRYFSFRVAAEPPYLPEGVVPDRLDDMNDYIVLSFLNEKANSSEKERIKNELLKRGHYSDMALRINSNYPEWVLLVDSAGTFSKVIKDAWYKPLDDLIELHAPASTELPNSDSKKD